MQMRPALGEALLGGAIIAAIGSFGVVAGVPWLFPSLGPTLALQVSTPTQATARPANIVVGYAVALAAGLLAVYLSGAFAEPAVTSGGSLTTPRVMAAAIAVLLCLLGQSALKRPHPPAVATTLLVALGAFEPSLHGALILTCGIALVTVFGEMARRWRLRQFE
jgi:hypothetical protein